MQSFISKQNQKAMKTFLPMIFCLPFLLSAQSIEIDYNTMGVTCHEKEKFKVGDFVSVCIKNYNPDKDDKFSVEITGEQYENTSGIAAFSTAMKKDNGHGTANNKYCLLSLQVPDADKSMIRIVRYDATGKNVKEERSYVFRNKGGLKFDVSSGFFVTNLRDNVYTFRYLNDSTKQIIKENNGKINLGIGLLAHLHCRSQSGSSFGLTGGFEINHDTKIGFLAGGSWFFGYDRKFVFSVGTALKKVKTLSDLYKVYDKVPLSANTIPTVEIWKCGWFGALTYNF